MKKAKKVNEKGKNTFLLSNQQKTKEDPKKRFNQKPLKCLHIWRLNSR